MDCQLAILRGQVWLRLLFLFIVLALAGCGGSRTSPVDGVVLLDGKPLAGATIQFVPQGSGRDATGESDKNGQFTMSTFEPRDGAVPGTYKVVISQPLGTADTATYGSSDDAMSAAAKSKPAKTPGPAFPLQYTRPDTTPLTQEVPVRGSVKYELKS
jgi:hypothetical protein